MGDRWFLFVSRPARSAQQDTGATGVPWKSTCSWCSCHSSTGESDEIGSPWTHLDPMISAGLALAPSTSAPDAPPVLGALPRALTVSRTLGVAQHRHVMGLWWVCGCWWVIDVKLSDLHPFKQLELVGSKIRLHLQVRSCYGWKDHWSRVMIFCFSHQAQVRMREMCKGQMESTRRSRIGGGSTGTSSASEQLHCIPKLLMSNRTILFANPQQNCSAPAVYINT